MNITNAQFSLKYCYLKLQIYREYIKNICKYKVADITGFSLSMIFKPLAKIHSALSNYKKF